MIILRDNGSGVDAGSRSRVGNPRRRILMYSIAACWAMLAPQHRLHAGEDVAPAAAGDRVNPAPPLRIYDLRIVKRRLAGGATTLRVVKGERVEIHWTSDETTTVHLHGYDIETAIAPGTPASMTFDAYATGRFPLRAHGFGEKARLPAEVRTHQETTLLYLEVHPR